MNQFKVVALLLAGIIMGVLLTLAYTNAAAPTPRTTVEIVGDSHSSCHRDRANPICDPERAK